MTGRFAILHNEIAPDAAADARDVLVQVDAVRAALRRRDIDPVVIAVNLNLAQLAGRLDKLAPDLVINLVESLGGSGRLAFLVPALLEHLGLPFTGEGASAMLLTTNKLLAKRWLTAHAIPTPPILGGGAARDATCESTTWIVKPVWEDASVGLQDDSVVTGEACTHKLLARRDPDGADKFFAEQFVAGREFNASLLATRDGFLVLPPAEICFDAFPADKPRIVGYRAKWQPDSPEYRGTVRRPLQEAREPVLAGELRDLAARCWRIFGLRGYARVDFRVDEDGGPWVLEINANPCLSPDAGFVAALEAAGLAFDTALAQIMSATRPPAGYTEAHD